MTASNNSDSRDEDLIPNAEAYLDVFQQYTHEVFIVTDEGLKVLYVSDSVTRILGWKPEELVGTVWEEWLCPSDVELFWRNLRRAVRHGRECRLELKHRHVSGFLAWVEVVGRVREVSSGSQWVFSLRDVSSRKTAQKQLEMTLNELRSFKQVLDAHAVVSVVDAKFNITYVNEKFCEISGYTLEELIGKNHRILKSGEHEDVFYAELYETILKGEAWRGELCDKAFSGERYWLDSTIVPFFNRDDEPTQFMFIAYDITAHKESQDALNRSRESLLEAKISAESANAAKSQFLARMSHELRTPLNSIIGYSQLLQKQNLEESPLSAVGVIERSGRHLLDLINELLDISRIETGKLQLEERVFNMRQCVESVCDMFATRARQKQLGFYSELANGLPVKVCADELRLRQILINLLGNALKFTDSGHIRLRVFVGEDNVSFEVEDTGIGIDESKQESAFEPFKQLSDREKYGGSGLGLAISRNLAVLMGGQLALESEEGKGTKVTLTLPLSESSATVPDVASGLVDLGAYIGSSCRILIVDDFQDNRSMYRDLLEPMGFVIDEASDGVHCLEKMNSFSPDLVLMDIRMPRMDGLEAMRRIRAMPEFVHCRIIAITAGAYEKDMDACFQAGCNAFLSKPVDFGELVEIIGEQLGLESRKALKVESLASSAPIKPPSDKVLEAIERYLADGDIVGLKRFTRESHSPFAQEEEAFMIRVRELAQRFDIAALRALIENIKKGKN